MGPSRGIASIRFGSYAENDDVTGKLPFNKHNFINMLEFSSNIQNTVFKFVVEYAQGPY